MIALRLNNAPARRALSPDSRVKRSRGLVRMRRPRSAASLTAVLLGILLLGAFGLLYVAATASATQASYQINQLKADQQKLIAQQQSTRYQISMATSAGRLDGDASRMGMVPQSQIQYLPGSHNPVALAGPQQATPTVPKGSLLQQLATILGRPTEAQAKGQ
jgi:hypothetical protein